jgi:hypothetical protein
VAQDDRASAILERVNTTRSNDGILSLSFNAQLQQAAQRHSDDMAMMDILTHVGSDGSQFWERIQDSGYSLSTGAENVLARGDTNPQLAFEQWFNSEAHRLNILNPEYSEVGIAYARSGNGRYYFTMVLAAGSGGIQATATYTPRPDNTAIPPTLPPTNTLIPPTIAAINTPLPPPTMTNTPRPTDPLAATIVAPLPTNTQQVAVTRIMTIATDTPIPSPTEYIPPDIRLTYDYDNLTLLNVSGRPLNLVNIIFESSSGSMRAMRWDTEFLTQSLSGFSDEDCLQVWGLAVDLLPKPDDCRFRHSWISVAEDATFWRNTETFTVRNGDKRVGICLVVAGVCQVNLSTPIDDNMSIAGTPTGMHLRFVYDSDNFTLINVSGRALDIRGITFHSDSGEMFVERWNTEFLTQPLTTFRSGDCLQVWGFEIGEAVLVPPDECIVRHGWVAVGNDYDFWRNTDSFTIERYGVVIGRCATSEKICEVSLSANYGAAEENAAQALPTTADIRLFISDTSVTLMNTSESFLDVSRLVFESSNGVFAATRWNIPELSQALYTIPSGGCLQVWAVGDEYLAAPRSCSIRHAWVAVAFDAQFWINTHAFTVRSDNQVLRTCEVRAEICDFDLP